MHKRIAWIALSAIMIGGLILAACTPETVVETIEVVVTVPGTGETEVIVVTATPEPVAPTTFESGDPSTLYYASSSEGVDTLDPAWNYESEGDAAIRNIYDQLVTYDGTSATSFIPSLAEDWEISEDGMTYTFYIREGVTFHNGNDLTPGDVAYTFRRGILQGGTWSPQLLFTEPILGIGVYDIAEVVAELEGLEDIYSLEDDPEAVAGADPDALMTACEMVMEAIVYDDAAGTVTFNLSTPWAIFLPTLANSWGGVIDQEWSIEQGTWDGDCATWQNYYGVTSETTPLRAVTNGTGPYMLDSWNPGQELVMVANPNFWRVQQNVPLFEGGPVGPSIERIVQSGVQEWGTRYAMLQAGDADFTDVPRENVIQVDPLVGEWCEYVIDTGDFECQVTNESAPLRLYRGAPSTNRTDAMFVFDVNDDGGNPYLGSAQLDGNGIPADFFSDIHVRRAFNYCFDWDAYIQEVLAGEAIQSIGYMLPGMLGYDPEGPHYSYDPDMCAAELQQAWDGQVWENGFRMQIAYNTGGLERQTIAQILQNNLQAIDPKFNIEIIGLPWPSFLAAIRASQIPLYISGWQEDFHDPHNWAQPFLVGTYAYRQRMSEEVRLQFLELVSAGVVETDEAERTAIYQQLTQMDYDLAPAIRLAVATGRHYQQRWVGDYYYNSIYSLQSRYMTLTKQ
ncbi:MAG: ABC transporter substrate-binding protein [Anaerolineae bacterium]|nr:ABC transporter substrate-binding protein [Anaerolineae bacterium]